MKLTNKGWGTLEMFLLSGGLFLALLVAIFLISKLYGSMDGAFANGQYVDLENKIETAAQKYIESNEIEINEQYKLTLNTLESNNFINELKDKNGNNCNGYVLIINNGNNYSYKGYVSCNGYQTKDY